MAQRKGPQDLVVGQVYSLDELGEMMGVELTEESRIVVPGVNTIPYAYEGWLDDPKAVRWFALCPECDELIELNERKDEESFSKREYREHYEQEHGGQG